MSPFKSLGIKTKYAIALTLRNSGKVLLVSITTIIASVALMVGISTIGQASLAYNNTVASTNYEYKVDLLTPTTEGGQYSRVYYGKDGNGNLNYYLNSDFENHKYNSVTDALDPTYDESYAHNTLPYGKTFDPSESSDEVRKSAH